jgi:hypothetical protein
LASVVADSWSNWPVIVVWPLIAFWIVGAETTRPSRVKATLLPMLAAVYSAQSVRPCERKSSRTIHSPVVGSVPACASAIWVPSMIVGPSRYLTAPSSEQAAT